MTKKIDILERKLKNNGLILDYSEYDGSNVYVDCVKEIYEELKQKKFSISRLIMEVLGGLWERSDAHLHGLNVQLHYEKVYDMRPWQINGDMSDFNKNLEFEWEEAIKEE